MLLSNMFYICFRASIALLGVGTMRGVRREGKEKEVAKIRNMEEKNMNYSSISIYSFARFYLIEIFNNFYRNERRALKSYLGLVWLLSIWAIAGAAAFCATEGPREREQVVELKDMQKDLAVGLATELRQLRTENEEDMEPLWSDKVRRYVAKHEQLLLAAVNSGYGEANDGGQLWTFPGCVLFAVSLLTTLGELSELLSNHLR